MASLGFHVKNSRCEGIKVLMSPLVKFALYRLEQLKPQLEDLERNFLIGVYPQFKFWIINSDNATRVMSSASSDAAITIGSKSAIDFISHFSFCYRDWETDRKSVV